MAIDFLASARSTAIISLVAASFSAPVVVQGDALATVKSKLGGASAAAHAEPAEELLAGGVQFSKPGEWGRLGTRAVSEPAGEAARLATVVAALCPGGMKAGACDGDAKLTFLVYSGEDGRELPLLSEFGGRLDDQLARTHRGFARTESRMLSAADGTRYLDYAYTWGATGAERQQQRLAAYRHSDGSGVVVVGAGTDLDEHAAAIDEFLAGAHEPVEGH